MNKEKLLIVGAGGFGRVTLERAQAKYDCAFIDDGIEPGSSICDIKVIGKTDDLSRVFEDYKLLVVAIGNNKLRESIYMKSKEIGYKFPNIIDESAYISKNAYVGEGCIILNNVVIQNGSRIGNGVILNPGVEIHHDSRVENNVLIYTNSVIRSLASIGDRALIGSTLTVGNEVTIKPDQIVEDGHSIIK